MIVTIYEQFEKIRFIRQSLLIKKLKILWIVLWIYYIM